MLVLDLRTICNLCVCACIWLDANWIARNAWRADFKIKICRIAKEFGISNLEITQCIKKTNFAAFVILVQQCQYGQYVW